MMFFLPFRLKLEYYTGCDKFPQIISKKVFDDAQKIVGKK
jgi:hypothetical protein